LSIQFPNLKRHIDRFKEVITTDQKFKDEQKKIEKIQSLKELEEDIKRLK
jgi:hypothetical protein